MQIYFWSYVAGQNEILTWRKPANKIAEAFQKAINLRNEDW